MAFRSLEVGGRARRLIRRHETGLHIAPLRARFAASLINVLVAIIVLVLAIGAGAGAFFLVRRGRRAAGSATTNATQERRALRASRGDDPGTPHDPLVAKLRSPRVKLALRLCSLAVAVLLDSSQGPGGRVVGIRLVDARTGGRPSRRQAVVRVGTRQVWQAATTRLLPGPKVRSPREDESFQSELEAARREHGDDPEALNDALMRIYREHNVDPVRASCLPILARTALAAAIDVPAWSPTKQGLPDRLAGTVVILERNR